MIMGLGRRLAGSLNLPAQLSIFGDPIVIIAATHATCADTGPDLTGERDVMTYEIRCKQCGATGWCRAQDVEGSGMEVNDNDRAEVCGHEEGLERLIMATEIKDERFPEFWAGFGKRMEAAGDSPEVIARTTWHAAKCGSQSERDTILYCFHIAYEKPSAQNIITWCESYPQFAEDIRSHAAVAWDWARQGEACTTDGKFLSEVLTGECEGGRCYWSRETGYLEPCGKHESQGMEAMMAVDAKQRLQEIAASKGDIATKL